MATLIGNPIRKVTSLTGGKTYEVGKDGVTSIEASGSLFIAYVYCGGDSWDDVCSIDPELAVVEYEGKSR